MKTANHTPEVRGGISSRPMQDCVLFVVRCPKCRERALQHGYSRVRLFGFLDCDHPIEAYCAPCDEFWPIGAEERRAMLDALSLARTESPLRLSESPRAAAV